MTMVEKNEKLWQNKGVILTKLPISQLSITLKNKTGYQSNAKTMHSFYMERYEIFFFLYS